MSSVLLYCSSVIILNGLRNLVLRYCFSYVWENASVFTYNVKKVTKRLMI